MGIVIEYAIYEIRLAGFSPDIWLSEALFLFAFCNTKFEKLFHIPPVIFHISVTNQTQVCECDYENILFIKISLNTMTWIFALKLRWIRWAIDVKYE